MAAASASSSAKPSAASAASGSAAGLVEQFTFDGAQHVGGDAGVEVDRPGRWPTRTSPSRNSATAATSSAAVGRPLQSGHGALLQQVEHIPFGFADPPSDRGQLHRPGLPGQVPLGLVAADHAPAQRGQHQPPVQRRTVDAGAAGLLVGRQEVLDAAEPAGAERRAGRRTATPGCRTTPGPRRPRRCASVPSPAPPPARSRRRSGCPSGSRRAPARSATARADARPASGTPTRTWLWCRPCRRAGAATRRAGRARPARCPSGSARWIAASACAHCASSRPRPASSRPRWMRRTIVSPAIASQIRIRIAQCRRRNRRRPGCGAPARRRPRRAAAPRPRVPCPAWMSSGGPVRRISARCCVPVTASNAHVVRLAPPVSARRFSTS